MIYCRSARITLTSTLRSLEKQRHQFAENCRISQEPSRLFIFSHRDLYLLCRRFSENHPRILPDFSRSVGSMAPLKFAQLLRSSSVKSGCDEKREKRGQRGNACIAAGGNGRSCSQIVRNARSSAKASAFIFPRGNHPCFPPSFSFSLNTFSQKDILPFLLKKQFSKGRRYKESTNGRSIAQSIDRFHAHMHVVYADMQDTKLGGCVCMYDVAGVTILLSQTVFSLLVAHVLTRTSEAVPLIGTDPSFLPRRS